MSAGQRWKQDWPGEPAANSIAGSMFWCVCGKGQPSSLNEKFKAGEMFVEVQSNSCFIKSLSFIPVQDLNIELTLLTALKK